MRTRRRTLVDPLQRPQRPRLDRGAWSATDRRSTAASASAASRRASRAKTRSSCRARCCRAAGTPGDVAVGRHRRRGVRAAERQRQQRRRTRPAGPRRPSRAAAAVTRSARRRAAGRPRRGRDARPRSGDRGDRAVRCRSPPPGHVPRACRDGGPPRPHPLRPPHRRTRQAQLVARLGHAHPRGAQRRASPDGWPRCAPSGSRRAAGRPRSPRRTTPADSPIASTAAATGGGPAVTAAPSARSRVTAPSCCTAARSCSAPTPTSKAKRRVGFPRAVDDDALVDHRVRECGRGCRRASSAPCGGARGEAQHPTLAAFDQAPVVVPRTAGAG